MGLRCGICRDSRRAEIDRAMLAGDSDATIAKEYNHYTTTVTVHRAKHLDLSPARVSPQDKLQYREALKEFHIVSLASRVGIIQNMIDELYQVKAARAIAFAHCVGGKTGLVISRQKAVGNTVVTEEEIDLGLVRELKGLVQAASSLIGEWDPSGAGSADPAGGANVTIYQNIAGPAQQAIVTAAPKTGQDAKPRGNANVVTTIRALDEAIARRSIQSIHRDDSSGEVGGRVLEAEVVEPDEE